MRRLINGIEERYLEGRVHGFPRLLAGRPAGVEMGRADAEVDLAGNGAATSFLLGLLVYSPLCWEVARPASPGVSVF